MMLCPACRSEQISGNRFCEDCGARLDRTVPVAAASADSGPSCRQCGNGFDSSGYCTHCGAQRPSAIDDHLEVVASARLAGVSDRGRARSRNEDCVALGSSSQVDVLVVCDGVSNSQQPDRAARAAADGARDHLLQSLADVATNMEAGIRQAIRTADVAVRALPPLTVHPAEPSESTIIAAACRGDQLSIAWLGDSRAYWLDDAGMRQLTEDHSWVNEIVASGAMTREMALNEARAHAITRTLGGPPSDGTTDEPSVVTFDIRRDLGAAGWLILCTDGFWDLAANSEQFVSLVRQWAGQFPDTTDALTLAQVLVANACSHRGHDNVTVGVLKIIGPPTSPESADIHRPDPV